jgi:hypothetical protein
MRWLQDKTCSKGVGEWRQASLLLVTVTCGYVIDSRTGIGSFCVERPMSPKRWFIIVPKLARKVADMEIEVVGGGDSSCQILALREERWMVVSPGKCDS